MKQDASGNFEPKPNIDSLILCAADFLEDLAKIKAKEPETVEAISKADYYGLLTYKRVLADIYINLHNIEADRVINGIENDT